MSFSTTAEVREAVAALVLQWPEFRLSRACIPLGEFGSMADHRWKVHRINVIWSYCNCTFNDVQYLSVKTEKLWIRGRATLIRYCKYTGICLADTGLVVFVMSGWTWTISDCKLHIKVHTTFYLCVAPNRSAHF